MCDGLLYFEYIDSGFNEPPRTSIDVSVREGGRAVPFYIKGTTTQVEWRAMLQRYADAPLIEMVGYAQFGRAGKIAGTREVIPHENYRPVYEIDGDDIWVLALVHTSCQWPAVPD